MLFQELNVLTDGSGKYKTRVSTSPLSSSDKLFYVLIKSQEMVPFVTLGFFKRSFILKEAGSKVK